jgi:hypothetical protein
LKQIAKAGGNSITGGVVLAFGLLIREIHRVHFLDPEDGLTPGMPGWFADSLVELNWQDLIFEQMTTIL